MSELFASGRIVDLIIGLIVLEALALPLLHRRTGSGLPFAELAGLLVPGLCLLFALRGALTGAHWAWLALWLLAAFVAHLADLRRRWRRRGSVSRSG